MPCGKYKNPEWLGPCDQVQPPRSVALFSNTRTYPKDCPAFPLIVIVSDEFCVLHIDIEQQS